MNFRVKNWYTVCQDQIKAGIKSEKNPECFGNYSCTNRKNTKQTTRCTCSYQSECISNTLKEFIGK